jgi:hypothetical protein
MILETVCSHLKITLLGVWYWFGFLRGKNSKWRPIWKNLVNILNKNVLTFHRF